MVRRQVGGELPLWGAALKGRNDLSRSSIMLSMRRVDGIRPWGTAGPASDSPPPRGPRTFSLLARRTISRTCSVVLGATT